MSVWCLEGKDIEERDVLQERVLALEAECAALRKIISDCATAIGNGSGCSVDASLEFMAGIPVEIEAVMLANTYGWKVRPCL